MSPGSLLMHAPVLQQLIRLSQPLAAVQSEIGSI